MPEKHRGGFSLIELIFALFIVATILGIAIPRIQSGLELQLKTTARRLSSSIRYAYYEAVAHNRYYRLALDLSAREPSYWLEVSDKPVLIRTSEEEEQFQRRIQSLSVENRKALLEREPTFHRVEEGLSKGYPLPKGVRFRDVFVSHQPGKFDGGVSYLYFFPSGATERAVINLEDKDGEIYSLEVAPLSAKVRIRRNYWNYEDNSTAIP